MAKLVLNSNNEVLNEYELDKEVLIIGRKSSNDIHIDDPAVSGKHAKIFTLFNDSFIEDLDSTNGTFVNGNKISKHVLQNGESIFVGTHELKYIKTGDIRSEADFEKTKAVDMNTETSFGGDTKAPADASTGEPGKAKLQIISGDNTGKELQLTRLLTTLGNPDSQVAAITRRSGAYFLIAVDAGNEAKRPLINGTEVTKQHALENNDVIEVAGVQMRFNLM